MEKQYAPSAKDKKVSSKKPLEAASAPVEKKVETVLEEKKEEKKKDVKVEKIIKDKAVVNAFSSVISSKHSYAICDMIRGKTPDQAIEMLEQVLIFKRAVPMNNREVPHKKGMMAGRYPKNASKEFVLLLKQLKANAIVNGIEQPVITMAIANRGPRHYRRGGVRSKSTHVCIEVRDKLKLNKK